MSQPDFDGVYRTRQADGVFGRKQRDDVSSQLPPKFTPKRRSSQPPKGGNLPTSQAYPPFGGGIRFGEGDLGGDPTPVTPLGGKLGASGSKRSRKPKKPPFVIIEDTRENTPLTDWPEGAAVVEKGLDTGDYSIEGWENCFTIERKSITDLAGTMIGGYEPNTQKPKKRFNNELERMRHFDCAAVIVTATPAQLIEFRHHCGMDAHAALWNFGLAVFASYGIPVFPLTDEKTAARWIYDLARHYIHVRTKKNRSREDRAKQIAADWKF